MAHGIPAPRRFLSVLGGNLRHDSKDSCTTISFSHFVKGMEVIVAIYFSTLKVNNAKPQKILNIYMYIYIKKDIYFKKVHRILLLLGKISEDISITTRSGNLNAISRDSTSDSSEWNIHISP